jgi:hypothetical protein
LDDGGPVARSDRETASKTLFGPGASDRMTDKSKLKMRLPILLIQSELGPEYGRLLE